MKFSIGTTLEGERIWLTDRDLSTHVHALGTSQRGKSKLIEWICRELTKERAGFCLIDPHGKLYDNLVHWLAYVQPHREIVLLNPSYEKRVVGFNPFTLEDVSDETKLWSKVDRMVAATLRAWGQTDADKAPRLDRWLRTLYYTLLEQGLSIDAARYFLTYEHKAVRDSIIAEIRSAAVRDDWMTLLSSASKRGFVGRLESAGNRLQRFVTHPTVRRTMGLMTNNIDLQAIMDMRQILLVNLQPSDSLSEDAARVIGTLLLNEIWETMRRRTTRRGEQPQPFYLIIDEFQNFATPDVPDMLDQAAKYGLHLMLSHQRLSQLDTDLHGAVRNAQTRLLFGGLPKRDVQELLEGALPSREAVADDAIDDIAGTMVHAKRHFTLRRGAHPLTTVVAPYIEDCRTRPQTVEQYVEAALAGFLTVQQVDSLLADGVTHEARTRTLEPQGERQQRSEPRVYQESSLTAERASATRSKKEQQTESSLEKTAMPVLLPMLGRGGQQHKYLQQLLKRWAEERGYRATIEKPVLGGVGSVDIVLEQSDISIACEISITTELDHEIGNIEKCLAAGFSHVVFVSPEKKVLQKARKLFDEALGPVSAERVHLFAPEDFLLFLETLDANRGPQEQSVRGYKVKVAYRAKDRDEQNARKKAIAQTVVKALKRMRDRD